MKTIAVTIDDETLVRLDRRAGRQGGATGNRSKIVRSALREFLSRAERVIEEDRERQIFKRNRVSLRHQAAVLVKAQAKP